MMLVAGLGNPGPKYHVTRHNVGFQVVALAAEDLGIPLKHQNLRAAWGQGQWRGQKVVLCQPLTYMNRSGLAVVPLLHSLGLSPPELLVIYDDMDLPAGKLRLRPQGGAGGHRGLASIIRNLGDQDFPRLRVGIGAPPPGTDPADYVLSPFTTEELPLVEAAVEEAARGVEMVLREGVLRAMNHINTWEPPAELSEAGQDQGM